MTNNIVAQFSSSIGKNGLPKEYNVVEGSIFDEEFSETLDSSVLVLSQVKQEDKLSHIKTYDFVRVFDKSTPLNIETGIYDFDKIYLVDNFQEKENNIKEHLYGYSINLMSETKILEKWQCPNVVATHNLDKDGHVVKKTIYEYIVQYMNLYVPKVKFTNDGETWEYRPLVSYPGVGTEFYNRFNVPCADLPFNFPTLRQLLTALMQQVGCIPIVRNRVLSFLDFQKKPVLFGNGDFYLNNTVNFIKRALSSDSFANTLVNTSEQVIDSGNEVVCETLGFRDKSNAILRQEENLKLETSLPIYKINKCIMHAPGKENKGYIGSNAGCSFLQVPLLEDYSDALHNSHQWPIIFYGESVISNGTASVKFRLDELIANPNFSIVIKGIYFTKVNSDGIYETIGSREHEDIVLNDSTLTHNDEFEFYTTYPQVSHHFSSKSYTLTLSNIPQGTTSFLISGYFVNNTYSEKKDFTFIRFDRNDSRVTARGIYEDSWSPQDTEDDYFFSQIGVARFYVPEEVIGFKTWDITKLVVENSVRQTLENNFVKMAQDILENDTSTWTVDKISKYIYGTVGYSIGSKEISGFSDSFTVGSGGISWIKRNYIYLENIVNALEKGATPPISDLTYYYYECLKEKGVYLHSSPSSGITQQEAYEESTFVGFEFSYYNAGENDFTGEKKFFTSFFFDIWYQPLNSFNLAYVKSQEEIDFPLEQFDSGASGVSDFDRLSIHEQEQVDRIGNEVLTINQRTDDFSLIQDFSNGPLLYRDDTNRSGSIDEDDNGIDYIIFKRSFTVNNNCFNVTYVGSKDSILKDYFTSIRTKYRAYQYVDFNSSILRKERDTLFVRISSNLYDGDNKIRLGNYGEKSYNDLSYLDYFIYDFSYSEESEKRIIYEIENGSGLVPDGESHSVENQTVKNSVSSIVTSNMIGFIYEYNDNIGAGTYLRDITKDENVGGIPQTWQIWDESHNLQHKVFFSNKINFYPEPNPSEYDSKAKIKAKIAQIEKTPIINDFTYSTVFWVCDDNTDNNSGRYFYKDKTERINHTVQFIYYAPNKDVLLSEHFISGTPMIGRHEISYNACYYSNDFELNELPHDVPEGDIRIGTNCISIEEVANIPYIQVAFNNRNVVKMCYYDEETGKVTDIAVFKNSSETVDYQDFYFMINDTKSDYVLVDYHGVLYRKYKVSTYVEPDSGTAGNAPVSQLFPRTVEQIYDEED